MGKHLDTVPLSGIARIRDMMYSIKDPFRLDQGDVSFDTPDAVKAAIIQGLADNRTHYLQTNGLPLLREKLADKLRRRNRIPVGDAEEVMVTNGGVHALYLLCQALLEPGDEVIIPDPAWPPVVSTLLAAHAVPVTCDLHQTRDWRFDVDEVESRLTLLTRAIYLNSPQNPTGGVLTRGDLEQLAGLARERDLWVISDEAYEDVLFDGAEHVSIASLPEMYDRTLSLFTFSKSFAMTGLRLGYLVAKSEALRARIQKLLFLTASNVSSIIQYGGIGGLEAPPEVVQSFRTELKARRDFFYEGIEHLGGVFSGLPPKGAFYAFLRISPGWRAVPAVSEGTAEAASASLSWRMAEHLIRRGRIGCVPGVDFGRHGEGYIRFCFARERQELAGALEAMRRILGHG